MITTPVFQRVQLHDGRVVIFKTEALYEVAVRDARRFEGFAARFKKNYLKYHPLHLNRDPKWIVAGILLEFEADKFTRGDVLKWCAFAGEDLTLEAISGTLTQLQKLAKKPITLLTGKGPNSRWQVDKQSLASFLA